MKRLIEGYVFLRKVKETMDTFDKSETSCIESWERFKQDVKINVIERSSLIKHEEKRRKATTGAVSEVRA